MPSTKVYIDSIATSRTTKKVTPSASIQSFNGCNGKEIKQFHLLHQLDNTCKIYTDMEALYVCECAYMGDSI